MVVQGALDRRHGDRSATYSDDDRPIVTLREDSRRSDMRGKTCILIMLKAGVLSTGIIRVNILIGAKPLADKYPVSISFKTQFQNQRRGEEYIRRHELSKIKL